MRLATLNTGLEMWNEERGGYVSVPIGTTVQVTKPNEEWMEVRAPGGLMIAFPMGDAVRARLNYLDEGLTDATSDA